MKYWGNVKRKHGPGVAMLTYETWSWVSGKEYLP